MSIAMDKYEELLDEIDKLKAWVDVLKHDNQALRAQAEWLPIETKPPLTHVEECGEYRTDDGMLWYFKPTHWRPIAAR